MQTIINIYEKQKEWGGDGIPQRGEKGEEDEGRGGERKRREGLQRVGWLRW